MIEEPRTHHKAERHLKAPQPVWARNNYGVNPFYHQSGYPYRPTESPLCNSVGLVHSDQFWLLHCYPTSIRWGSLFYKGEVQIDNDIENMSCSSSYRRRPILRRTHRNRINDKNADCNIFMTEFGSSRSAVFESLSESSNFAPYGSKRSAETQTEKKDTFLTQLYHCVI
ncbi:hypothetical protein Avbf_02869, partial [Armadillidium vulgare]